MSVLGFILLVCIHNTGKTVEYVKICLACKNIELISVKLFLTFCLWLPLIILFYIFFQLHCCFIHVF